jgi:hypothetical protein
MAAFDVTTKPRDLPLKAGETGTIMVVVSNRLGKPVMGSIEGILTPASAAKWLVPLAPSETLRRYEADPTATVNFEFKIAVPEDAAAQDAQFKAVVRDSLAPDDTKVEGQTVAITVTKKVIDNGGRGGIPWWVWPLAAVVVLGAGFGIWRAIRNGGVPNVVKLSAEEATSKLRKAGFDSVAIVDTLGGSGADTNVVVRQVPAAKAKVSKDSSKLATIVVNRPAAAVPQVANQPLALAIEHLKQAGFVVGNATGLYTGDQRQHQTVSSTSPAAGTVQRTNTTVNLVVYEYSATPPPACPNRKACVVGLDHAVLLHFEQLKTTH